MKKGTVVSFMNNKGGVAKTMSAFNIGVAWARNGYKVLFIDLDSQATLTSIISDDDERYMDGWDVEIEDSFQMGPEACPLPIFPSKYENIDFVPTTLQLQNFDVHTANSPAKAFLLTDLIAPIKDQYDYIIIDCPPALGSLIINAMIASDGILLVTGANGPSFEGTKMITKVYNNIVSNDRLNPNLKLFGVLITNFENDSINKQMEELIRNTYKGYVMKQMIRKSTKLNQAVTLRISIFEHDPYGRGAADYNEAAKELITNMDQTV